MNNDRAENWAMWTALVVYWLAWVLGPVLAAGQAYWYAGAIMGTVYVFMHIQQIKHAGHCYMSADGTAIPATILVCILFLVLHRIFWTLDVEVVKAFVMGGSCSFFLGHLLAIGYSIVVVKMLNVVFGMKATEKKHVHERDSGQK